MSIRLTCTTFLRNKQLIHKYGFYVTQFNYATASEDRNSIKLDAIPEQKLQHSSDSTNHMEMNTRFELPNAIYSNQTSSKYQWRSIEKYNNYTQVQDAGHILFGFGNIAKYCTNAPDQRKFPFELGSSEERGTSEERRFNLKRRFPDDNKFSNNREYLGDVPGTTNCYKCNKPGHFARECPEVICYLCGKSGHLSTKCPQAEPGQRLCYKCGGSDHLSRNCPKGDVEERRCYKCGSSGHLSRDCTETDKEERRCFKCGDSGHLSNECPKRDMEERTCYKCGGSGHLSRECPEKDKEERRCYRCGAVGHISRDCGGGSSNWQQ